AEEVATADDDRDLDAVSGGDGDLVRDRGDHVRVEPDGAASEHLAGELQQDSTRHGSTFPSGSKAGDGPTPRPKYLGRGVGAWSCRSGAHAEPGVAGHGAAGLRDDLADRLLRVLGERLVEQHVLLEEAVETALDDLRERALGLALVARGLLGDATLVGDLLGRDVVAAEEGRRVRGDVHRDVLGDL